MRTDYIKDMKVLRPMNKDNLQLTIDMLNELKPHEFNMVGWFALTTPLVQEIISTAYTNDQYVANHKCETVACLAGHIQDKFAKTEKERQMHAKQFATDWLGLTGDQACMLFVKRITYNRNFLRDITLSDVVNVLNRIQQDGIDQVMAESRVFKSYEGVASNE